MNFLYKTDWTIIAVVVSIYMLKVSYLLINLYLQNISWNDDNLVMLLFNQLKKITMIPYDVVK